ncbi:SAM-dependent methyltransferase [Saccharophagus degradans]|uniref:tRNA (Adenine(22)-N(1))-methyltransferase TrmK n=1 Tax=Saccharophagus degradans TaxID=86304 RepID=A0AAW7X517_9GAMM|nr:SAM-dependent methyltransferase [Saccharophagus degradans]MDO6421771.1 tRNA (adenine(22)-N(1))-methyltransferase TrmK [Saccharophagus degradans]MDO6606535.1 tRNA (adenine(22)-N(1))-methyltransferase TrmK [Saccharophagus degradans]
MVKGVILRQFHSLILLLFMLDAFANNTDIQPLRQLRPRLVHLYNWAQRTPDYNAIWDLCCDHGLLGLHLHQATTACGTHVHLVDQVEPIIDKLQTQYAHRQDGNLSICLTPAEHIRLAKQAKQLFIIAGVGGETVASIIQSILPAIQALPLGTHQQIDILISPNKHVFSLRRTLQAMPFTLIEEEFVSDKGRHHEHMFLRYKPAAPTPPSEVGDALWLPATQDKRIYIDKLIKHYGALCQYSPTAFNQQALAAYQALKHKLFGE